MPLVSAGVFFDYGGYIPDINVMRRLRRRLFVPASAYESFNWAGFFTPEDQIPSESYNPSQMKRNLKRVAYLTGGAFTPSSYEAWNVPFDPSTAVILAVFPEDATARKRKPELDQSCFYCPFTPSGPWTEPGNAPITSSWTEPSLAVITSTWTEPAMGYGISYLGLMLLGQSYLGSSLITTIAWTEPAIDPITPSPQTN